MTAISSTSKATPPGRIMPRPKRLPQSNAVMFRKSPRMRPQYDMVGRIADIAGQRAQVADMVGQPFQFKRDASQERGPGRRLAAAQRFHGATVCRGVADGCIAGGGLYKVNPAL